MAEESQQPDTQNQGEQEPKRKPLALLAKETFGADFYGEVPPEDEPKKKPLSDDQAEGEEDEEPSGDPPNEDPDIAAQNQGDKTGEEEGAIESVQELIEHLEADPSWFDGLKVNVKVNDKTSQVPLRDLVANYQTNQAADQRLAQAKEKSEKAQQELEQRRQETEQQFTVAAKLCQMREEELTQEFSAIDWNRLQAEDPAMWAAQRQAFGERFGRVNQLKQAIANQYTEVQAKRKDEEAKKRAVTEQEQIQLLLSTMPKVDADWGDPTKIPAKRQELWDYLLAQGFTPEDIAVTADHRSFLIAQKALLWDKSQKKVELTKKRIRTVPKVLKPGAKREPSVINMEKVKVARATLAKSGKLNDALAVLRAKRRG